MSVSIMYSSHIHTYMYSPSSVLCRWRFGRPAIAKGRACTHASRGGLHVWTFLIMCTCVCEYEHVASLRQLTKGTDVPDELQALWAKACSSNCRAAKSSLFGKWIAAGKNFGRLLQCITTALQKLELKPRDICIGAILQNLNPEATGTKFNYT